MANILAWAFLLGAVVVAVGAAQCIKLFVLRRWHARVRLPDPVSYTDVPSFSCDKDIVLRIHSSKPVRIRIHRCGASDFICVHDMEAPASLQTDKMHRWRGFDWKASAVLPGNMLIPGFYRIDIEHQDNPSRRWCMPLIVKGLAQQPVVVVASTNTWNAYNDFGGLSNYQDRVTPQPLKMIRALMKYFHVRIRIGDRHWIFAVPLPEQRPNVCLHHNLAGDSKGASYFAREEAALIRLLERERIGYTVISDSDFAYNMSALRARLIIFNTHSEYWSEEMIGRLAEFIDRNVSILFLSGNNIYRKVQFTGTGVSVIDSMTPLEQVVPLIGTYYDASGYRSFDGYRVIDAGHWCFKGLAVQEGSEFGQGNASRPAASGYETDKIRFGGNGFRVVAVGKNREGPAYMVCRELGDGGFVFTVGSVSFTRCLDDDSFIQGLVLNLIRRASPLEKSETQ
jgi:N,N-dimethylformamidase